MKAIDIYPETQETVERKLSSGLVLRFRGQQVESVVRTGGANALLDRFLNMMNKQVPLCIKAALEYSGLLFIEEPARTCDCPLAAYCGNSSVETLGVERTKEATTVIALVGPRRVINPVDETQQLEQLMRQTA